jgi:hypothetical protein
MKTLAALAAIALAACAFAPNVQTTFDFEADLTKYRTFAFVRGDPAATGAITDAQVRDRLERLITMHLESRGYALAARDPIAGLAVHYAGHMTSRQQVFRDDKTGPYDYGWGRTQSGGSDSMNYRPGMLIIDVVDLSRGQLLWRTRLPRTLSAGYSEENWKKIDSALGDAFSTLPARR